MLMPRWDYISVSDDCHLVLLPMLSRYIYDTSFTPSRFPTNQSEQKPS